MDKKIKTLIKNSLGNLWKGTDKQLEMFISMTKSEDETRWMLDALLMTVGYARMTHDLREAERLQQ